MIKNKINILIIIVITVLVGGYLIIMDDPKSLLNAIKAAKVEFLLCAVGCMILYWLFESLSLKVIFSKINSKLRFRDSFRNTMIGQFFNSITPFQSGGQPVQAYHLVKCGIPLGEASCVLLVKFIVYQVALTVLSLVVILIKFNFFMSKVLGFGYLVLVGFLVHFAVVVFLFGIGFFPTVTKRFLTKLIHFLAKIKIIKDKIKIIERLDVELKHFYRNFLFMKQNPHIFILPAVFTTIQLIAFFSVPYFVCLSLGAVSLNYFTIICAGAFVSMISSFVPIPGATGVAEGSFYLFFSIFIFAKSELSITIILWRVLTFYLPIFAGVFFVKKGKKIGTTTTEELS
ncbi:MAG: hypothetical protein K0R90_1487 [Oscillospiraceae bacterium]|nr:hypothetical protein [Oscillospiraceae bacterium]